MFANHLLFRKQRGGSFRNGKPASLTRKRTRQLPPRLASLLNTTFNTTLINNNSTTALKSTVETSLQLRITSTESLGAFVCKRKAGSYTPINAASKMFATSQTVHPINIYLCMHTQSGGIYLHTHTPHTHARTQTVLPKFPSVHAHV